MRMDVQNVANQSIDMPDYEKKETKKRRFNNRPDAEVLSECQDNIQKWYDYFFQNNQRYKQDIHFSFVSQWDEDISRIRKQKHKSILDFNRIYTHLTQVLGEQRESGPDFKVRAGFKDFDQHDVDIRSGLIRSIAYKSRAEIAYQTCFRSQLCGGYGAIMVDVDYVSEDDFDIEPLVYHISDPTMCFWDPSATQYDKSDGNFCGKAVRVNKKDLAETYGLKEEEIGSFNDVTYQASWMGWGNDDEVTVVDYYKKEYYKETMCKMSDGRTIPLRDAKLEQEEFDQRMDLINSSLNVIQFQDMPSERPVIEDRRTVRKYRIIHYKLIRDKVLDRSEWPSRYLPIIFADGDSEIINCKQHTKSFIHFCKDAQKMLNLAASETADALIHSNRQQWIADPSSFDSENIKNIWRNPDRHDVLLAKYDSRGNMPQRIQPFTLSSTLFNIYSMAESSISETLGRYQSNMGAQANETSGVAIDSRIRQGNASTFVYFDNLHRAIESVGRVLMDMIPRLYDGTRDVSLISDNGDQKIVTLNNPTISGVQNQIDNKPYSIEISVGPNYEIQKQKALQTLMDMVRLNPQTAPLLQDLIAENLDLENTPQIVERMKSIVPPQIIAKENGEPPPPTPPDPQQQMMQMQMKLQQANMQLKQREQALKEMELQQNEQKIALDHQQQRMQAGVAIAKTNAELGKAQMDYDKARAEYLKDRMPY